MCVSLHLSDTSHCGMYITVTLETTRFAFTHRPSPRHAASDWPEILGVYAMACEGASLEEHGTARGDGLYSMTPEALVVYLRENSHVKAYGHNVGRWIVPCLAAHFQRTGQQAYTSLMNRTKEQWVCVMRVAHAEYTTERRLTGLEDLFRRLVPTSTRNRLDEEHVRATTLPADPASVTWRAWMLCEVARALQRG